MQQCFGVNTTQLPIDIFVCTAFTCTVISHQSLQFPNTPLKLKTKTKRKRKILVPPIEQHKTPNYSTWNH